MGSLYMSSTTYRVFENTENIMQMMDFSVFANGCEMPWSYYESDVMESTQNALGEAITVASGLRDVALRRLMWTSCSKASSDGKIPAGVNVSQIKRKTKLGSSYIDEVINNPTIEDYKSWQWPLKSDEEGNLKLPVYGDFAFRPGMAPSYEDASNITVTFKFGFGLNNTCYNFADEVATIKVFNLSSAPKFYLTNNSAANPYLDKDTQKWTGDMIEADENGNVKTSINEGTNDNDSNNPFYKYLLIRVEAGEQIIVQRTGDALDQISTIIDGAHSNASTPAAALVAGTSYTDDDLGIARLMKAPYKMNVVGESNEISPSGLKYDFYRLKLSLTSANQDLAFLTDNTKKLALAVSPVVYGDNKLDSFKRNVTVSLDVTKKISKAFIRDDLQMSIHGFEDTKYITKQKYDNVNDLSDQSNLRVRNIITADEAIHYAVSTGTGPSFCRGKTAAQALYEYKRSILTATEKNLDDYKKQFANEEKLKRFAFYVAIDMSNHALENFQTFDASDNDGNQDASGIIDLSNVYNGYRFNGAISFYNELFAFKEACTDYL